MRESCQAVKLCLFTIVWYFIKERLTPERGIQIVQPYYENSRSVMNVFRALRSTYGQHNQPTERTNIRPNIASLYGLLNSSRKIRRF